MKTALILFCAILLFASCEIIEPPDPIVGQWHAPREGYPNYRHVLQFAADGRYGAMVVEWATVVSPTVGYYTLDDDLLLNLSESGQQYLVAFSDDLEEMTLIDVGIDDFQTSVYARVSGEDSYLVFMSPE